MSTHAGKQLLYVVGILIVPAKGHIHIPPDESLHQSLRGIAKGMSAMTVESGLDEDVTFAAVKLAWSSWMIYPRKHSEKLRLSG